MNQYTMHVIGNVKKLFYNEKCLGFLNIPQNQTTSWYTHYLQHLEHKLPWWDIKELPVLEIDE